MLDKSVWVVNALLLVDFPWRAARRNAARQQSSSAALSAITAAVVGVVLNLAVWFAIHNVFRETIPVRAFPLSFDAPDIASIDTWALALSPAAALAIFRFSGRNDADLFFSCSAQPREQHMEWG